MTLAELNEVRNLKNKICMYSNALENLRRLETLRTSNFDGLPKSKKGNSQVERIIVNISEGERKLESMNKKLNDEVAPALERKICAEFSNLTEQTLLIFRYVYCMFFRDISNAMGYSEKHIYKLHKKALEKLAG